MCFTAAGLSPDECNCCGSGGGNTSSEEGEEEGKEEGSRRGGSSREATPSSSCRHEQLHGSQENTMSIGGYGGTNGEDLEGKAEKETKEKVERGGTSSWVSVYIEAKNCCKSVEFTPRCGAEQFVKENEHLVPESSKSKKKREERETKRKENEQRKQQNKHDKFGRTEPSEDSKRNVDTGLIERIA